MIIPPQLQRTDFRFVKIPRASKAPCESLWTTVHNYTFNDPNLMAWIENGNNYGVCCGFGNLVGIDSDHPIVAELFELHFRQTFRVQSGSGRGFHDYVIVRGMQKKVIFERGGKHLGEAQFAGQQLVGPGSVHPCGGIYKIVRDLPMVEIVFADFAKAFAGFAKGNLLHASPPPVRRELRASGDLQSIPLTTIVAIEGTLRGDTIQGPNPWHGSTTGQNFSLNTMKNEWFCFRCHAGGGVAKAIALTHSIIKNCADRLSRADFLQVLQIAQKKYGWSPISTERKL